MELKIVTIVGARPQFIKAAAVSRAIKKHNASIPSSDPAVLEVIVHTGQHFDKNMSDIFFDELEIPRPNYNLGVCNTSHGSMTGQMLEKIEAVLIEEKPNLVIVYGDTNSTLAGALAAAKLQLPVAHVEAGLRSFNRSMPEEINRLVADHVSAFLFCPTQQAVDNLNREGITRNVFKVGDVMYDAFIYYGSKPPKSFSVIEHLGLKPKEYILATIHRSENTDSLDRLQSIIKGLIKAAGVMPVILPLHPRTRQTLLKEELFKEASRRLCIIDPVGYLDMIMLEKNARIIATDSGGVQKEAFFSQVPCLTLREETEWVELLEAGCNLLVGTDDKRLFQGVQKFLSLKPFPPATPNLYGDGQCAKKILKIIVGKPFSFQSRRHNCGTI